MPIQYRTTQLIVNKLLKKGIIFTHMGDHLLVQERHIGDHDRLIMSQYEKKPLKGEQTPEKPKKERPPAVYSNRQWSELYQ